MKSSKVMRKELSNEKETKKSYKKFILHLFAALFCIIAVIFLVFGIKGTQCIEMP